MSAVGFHLSRRHYMDAILVVLDRLGGGAAAADVQVSVRRELDRYMTETDLGSVPSNEREVRWKNDTRWAREQLVTEGLLQPVHIAGRGVWRLTSQGRAGVADAALRLTGSRAGGRSRLTPDARAVRLPADGPRQLTFLAQVFRRAHETPVGDVAHPALFDIMATLERLLQAKMVPPPPVDRPPVDGAHRSSGGSTPRWAPPTPTATVVPNFVDAGRMRAFIDGPWRNAVNQMQQLPAAERAARIHDLDLLAALPAVTCLVAARSAWLLPTEAAGLAARSIHRVMTEALRPGGIVGGLPLGAGGEIAAAMRDGLFHRTLTGWVQHLDATADEALALRAAPLRGWLSSFRAFVGDPEGHGPQRADPLWDWLFEVDPSFEPPAEGGTEEAAREVELWLRAGAVAPQADPPHRGALLWHPLWAWAVALGDSRSRFDQNFSAYILETSEEVRLKFFAKTGWVDVERAATATECPEMIRTGVARVADIARQTWCGK